MLEHIDMQVVKIINDYQVVINAGSDDGITKKTRLQIIDEEGEPVLEPSTGNFIGRLDLVKEYIKPVKIYENMSICENAEENKVNLFGSMMNPFEVVERKKLNVDLSQVTSGDTKSDVPIRIGDKVISS